MITYQVAGQNAAGDYLIAYATPGMPHVLTVAGVASCESCAAAECARLNQAQGATVEKEN